MATNFNAVTTAPRSSKASWRRFWLLTEYNFKMYARDKIALFWNIAFPIGLMLLFGAMYGTQSLDPKNPAAGKVITYLVPGILVQSLLSNGLIGNSSLLAEWRAQGILQRIQATPLPVWQLTLSRLLVNATVMVLQACLLVATSVIVFGASFSPLALLSALPVIVVVAVVCMSFGQMVAALVKKPQTVGIVTQVIYFPLLFLGGLIIPLYQMPEALQTIGKWLPSGMMGDLIRVTMISDLVTGKDIELTNLPPLVSTTGLAVYFLIATAVIVRFFRWR